MQREKGKGRGVEGKARKGEGGTLEEHRYYGRERVKQINREAGWRWAKGAKWGTSVIVLTIKNL